MNAVPSRLPVDVLIGEVPKNKREVVRAQLREFKGVELVDLRVFAESGDKMVPTAKGISIAVAKIDDLIALLHQARIEAEHRGILEPEVSP